MKHPPVFLTGLLLASMAASQEVASEKPFSEVIDVEVINLDVYVTGRDGSPVSGLRHDDFELYESGQPTEVTNFYAVEGGRRIVPSGGEGNDMASASAPPAAAEPLFMVVFVDNVHLGQFGRNRVLEQLRALLKERMRQGNQVMLVTFDGRVELRQSFTDDWREVKRTLDELAEDPGLGHQREREHLDVIDNIVQLSDFHANLGLVAFRTPCPRQIEYMARSHAEEVYGRVAATVASLTDFVGTLGSLPGRKALVHVSDGIPLLPGAEAFEFLCHLCGPCGSQTLDLSDTANPDSSDGGRRADTGGSTLSDGDVYDGSEAQLAALANDTTGLFEELTRQANAHRVTFFALEARGPRSPASSDIQVTHWQTAAAVQRVRVGSLQDTLSHMAERTGGRAIFGTTDFTPAFARIAEDFDTYYSLGYRRPRSAEGRDLRVKVKVRRPALSVRYRKSLRTQPLAEQLANRTLASLMYDLADNPLGIEIEIGDAQSVDKSLHVVPIRLRIPLGNLTLLPEDGQHRGQLTLYITGRDRRGRLTPVRTSEIPIHIPAADIEQARGQLYFYEVKMLMRQGDHSVAVGVHDDLGQVASYMTEDVMVFPR